MSGKFEPKTAVQLNPPKDDVISQEELARSNGTTTLPPATIGISISISINIMESNHIF
jgi:Ethanolamine utilization protein EutJ (predicted chaperonin)